MILFIMITALVALTSARPNDNIGTKNVIVVPPNCGPGQQWVNGQCRDIWRMLQIQQIFEMLKSSDPEAYAEELQQRNVVTVPPNCPVGQEWYNGACRDVWLSNAALNAEDNQEQRNVVTVPPNCPEGQEWYNGACRDVWLQYLDDAGAYAVDEENQRNVVITPPNCPIGQKWHNGACRDIWAIFAEQPDMINLLTESEENHLLDLFINVQEQKAENDDKIAGLFNQKNIISIPNQCPTGYKPDANGICREIF